MKYHIFIPSVILLSFLAGFGGGISYDHFFKKERCPCVIDLKYLMDQEKQLLIKNIGRSDKQIKQEINRFTKCLEKTISSRQNLILVKAAVVSGAKDITPEVEKLCLSGK